LFKDYIELKAEELGSCCFINDGKGNFKKMELPDELQMAPVFAFAPSLTGGGGSIIAGGNFYNVIPYEGRYDALLPTAFTYSKQESGFRLQGNLPSIEGEVRDIKWVGTGSGQKILVIARNNRELLFYKSNR